MSVTRNPVRYDFDDYVSYTEMHPDGAFELIDGAIYTLAPEGDSHALTRSGIYMYLAQHLDLDVYTPWSEVSFRAPGWADGPRPDVFVSRGPWLVDGKFSKRPTAKDIALVIEVSSTSRPKDKKRAVLFAKLGIAEYWLVDLTARCVLTYDDPRGEGDAARYRSTRQFARNETIASTSVNELTIGTDFLLQLAAT